MTRRKSLVNQWNPLCKKITETKRYYWTFSWSFIWWKWLFSKANPTPSFPENGDVVVNGTIENGQDKQLGENALILASRSPTWVPENTGLGQSYDNSNVPTLPPISPGMGLRMLPAAPPPSRTDIISIPQRRISVESHNFNDNLPLVQAHNGHIPAVRQHVQEPMTDTPISAPQSASSRNDGRFLCCFLQPDKLIWQ